MDYRLTQTGAEVQGILDRSPLEVTGAQLDTFITEASEGWYLVPIETGGSMLVQVVMDGPVVYQVGLTEPHSGRIVLRHYNTQATNPAWTEWTDAYVDKLTSADIAFGHVSDSGMKITIGGVDHIVSQTSQPLGSSNAFVAPTWEALTIALETKQDTINDLSTIRSGAAAGATAYQKPGTGIPASDMASSVQTDLGKAASALQPSALNDYYNKTQVDTALGNKQNTLTFDSTPTASSSNPVTSDGIKAYVDNHSSSVTVDDELSTTSENPVQNKVVTIALNGKQATIDDLSTIRSGAAAGATAYQKPSGGIPSTDMASAVQTSLGKADSAVQPSSLNDYYTKTQVDTALAGKQATLTLDNSPTNGSNNPVKSGGVYTALLGKQNTLTFDDSPTSGSNNPVKSGGIYTALGAKQNTLTFDENPTSNSNNPVKSKGIKNYVDNVSTTISNNLASNYYNKTQVDSLIIPQGVDAIPVASLPASGAANTIYFVQGTNSFTISAWDGTAWITLATIAGTYDAGGALS